MTLNTYLDAAFLGAIEGLTEFIPVSSTGHLILFGELLNFNDESGKIFEVVIQLGAILAVCVLYFQKLFDVVRGTCTGDKQSLRFTMAVSLAFIPSVILGVLLHDFIKTVLFSPYVVAVSLIVGGIIIYTVEQFHKKPATVHATEEFTPMLALKIGFAQCLAMIPGVSRSGATIIGALLLGVERKAATEFSFFLAIPTMAGAAAYDLYKGHAGITHEGMVTIAIGFVCAFIVAMAVIRWFVGFVGTHGFKPFAIYRIIFGLIILGWLYFNPA